MYSRAPTTAEALIIETANVKIQKEFGDNHGGDLPFSQQGLESTAPQFQQRPPERLEAEQEQDAVGVVSEKLMKAVEFQDLFLSDVEVQYEQPQSGAVKAKVKGKKPARKIGKRKAKDNLTAEERGLDSSSGDENPKESKRKDCSDGNVDEEHAAKKVKKNKRIDLSVENVDEEQEKKCKVGNADGLSSEGNNKRRKGWKGWTLVDVKEVQPKDLNEPVKEGSQESKASGKVRKSKRKKEKM
ncbi:uncharacterized protein MELLADRAFT_87922 [Melampsora larici-populina 98AG31]|uniref:Uncharacterized protein n=1 Tax=Melampsora larici-populina (strain 98AG31 / pathotype 3-4-7) TaxID=747676 RepID=F4RQ05_MELLP|nr:uncharacterized protein MELLADRAFT_87922 [Melampsora larici-populina 98AG31]EGG05630.1 hypothetical protein MELLADRAFT_87922 [Melampsora larici-populina 98AG31]